MNGRLYLGSFDYAAAALDRACILTPARGNPFLLMVDGNLPWAERLAELPEEALRLLHGRRRRAWQLAPYWQPGAADPVFVETVSAAAADRERAIADYWNTPLPPGAHLACRRLTSAEGSGPWLFKFSHQLFDGGGAELFVKTLLRNPAELGPGNSFLNHPELRDWSTKFRSGQRVNRFLRALPPISALPAAAPNAASRFRRFEFEVAPIRERSDRLAGPLMLGVYLAAVAGCAFGELSAPPGALLLPVTADRRQRRRGRGHCYGNHWSCLPLLFERRPEWRFADYLAAARGGFTRSVSEGIPVDFENANYLTRIAPLNWFAAHCSGLFHGTGGSLMFSFIPDSGAWDDAISGVSHLPAMPPSPGLGVVFSQFRDRLFLVLSYREGVLPEPEIEHLAGALVRRLQEGEA